MKLPNGERAFVDIAKLRDYCLNPSHEVGKHKARVFASALGITSSDAEYLRSAILSAARTGVANLGRRIPHGQLYFLDFEVGGEESKVTVRTGWIIRDGEGFPRLTSCYVL